MLISYLVSYVERCDESLMWKLLMCKSIRWRSNISHVRISHAVLRDSVWNTFLTSHVKSGFTCVTSHRGSHENHVSNSYTCFTHDSHVRCWIVHMGSFHIWRSCDLFCDKTCDLYFTSHFITCDDFTLTDTCDVFHMCRRTWRCFTWNISHVPWQVYLWVSSHWWVYL